MGGGRLIVGVVAAVLVLSGNTGAADEWDGLSAVWSYVAEDVWNSGRDGALPSADDWSANGETVGGDFGWSVAPAGDVNGDGYNDVIVGAPSYNGIGVDQGKVYVFHGSASGLSPAPDWTVEGDAAGDRLGVAVSTAGDFNNDGYADVIIGAEGVNASAGRAVIYLGSPTGIEPLSTWFVDGESAGDKLGAAVAAAGDVDDDGFSDILVGAPARDASTGKVYIYPGNPAALPLPATWTSTGAAASDEFGCSIAGAGDVNGDGYSDILVGARLAAATLGQAYVFHGSIGGVEPAAAWSATGEAPVDLYGGAVAAAGDINGDGYSDVVIGASANDGRHGKAYVYQGSAAGVEAAVAWSATGQSGDDRFGAAASSAGDVNGDGFSDIIVGAYDYSASAANGKAFVFKGGPTGLTGTAAEPYWSGAGLAADDNYGFAAAGAGDVNGDGFSDIIVGAYGVTANIGTAYVYHGSGDGLAGDCSAPAWDAAGETAGSSFGDRVSLAGDVNGDGHSDLIVGAWNYNGTQGRAYVFHGSDSGVAAAAAWSATGEAVGDYFGRGAAGAGDVNGDGYSDIIVGAYGYNGSRGKAYVFHGSASGVTGATADPAWSVVGDFGDFGSACGSAGDVNGDGYSDVIIGASTYSGMVGNAYVFHGSAAGVSGTEASPAWSAAGESGSDRFGCSVAGAGDVNGDGYSDVIVGAYGYFSNAGAAYVFHGSASGIGGTAASPAWKTNGLAADDYYGMACGSAGDVNGDGYSDVVVGAPDGAGNDRAQVFLGTGAGLNIVPQWSANSEAFGDKFGWSVAAAGDVDKDGYADVIIGAPDYGAAAGKVYLFRGSSAGLTGDEENPAWSSEAEADLSYLGYSVSAAGDVNGDGYADVVTGASRWDSYTGKAYVFQGGGGGGRQVNMKVSRSDGIIIQGWSGRGDPNDIKESATGFSTQTRNQVQLKAQVLEAGKSWTADVGDIVSATGAWTDSGTAGAALSATPTGLTPKTYYKTRCRVMYDGVREFQTGGPWFYGETQTGGAPTATPDRGFIGCSRLP